MSKEREIFIQQHAQAVINACKGTGLFPSLTMAQMILESSGKDANGKFGTGKGIAVRKANNYFGVKADKSWKGEKVALSTPRDGKPVNYFRVYKTAQDSVADRNKFLVVNSRYKKNGVFAATTPEAQAWALQKAGYAEGRDGKGGGYADAIIKLINAYNLKSLDKAAGLKVSPDVITTPTTQTPAPSKTESEDNSGKIAVGVFLGLGLIFLATN